jgi:hypothetical protein
MRRRRRGSRRRRRRRRRRVILIIIIVIIIISVLTDLVSIISAGSMCMSSVHQGYVKDIRNYVAIKDIKTNQHNQFEQQSLIDEWKKEITLMRYI